jgi:hypothetical protein
LRRSSGRELAGDFVARMRRDESRPGLPGADERRVEPVVEADELARADGDRVRGLERVRCRRR